MELDQNQLFSTSVQHKWHQGTMAPSKNKRHQLKHTSSPFFAPSTPRKLVTVSTPGGTSRLVKKEDTQATENKSGVGGAACNLVNAIIGAGIVGIPFAIKETGLVAGVVLVVLCAVLTGEWMDA